MCKNECRSATLKIMPKSCNAKLDSVLCSGFHYYNQDLAFSFKKDKKPHVGWVVRGNGYRYLLYVAVLWIRIRKDLNLFAGSGFGIIGSDPEPEGSE